MAEVCLDLSGWRRLYDECRFLRCWRKLNIVYLGIANSSLIFVCELLSLNAIISQFSISVKVFDDALEGGESRGADRGWLSTRCCDKVISDYL